MGEAKKEVVENSFIRWLYELNKNSGPVAGGKGANLAEMFNNKFPVPPAFVITTKAYNHFIEKTGIKEEIHKILESIDVNNTEELTEKSKQIREIMIKAEMPEDLKEEILEAYEDLGIDKSALEHAKSDALNILKHGSEPVFVAIRSSATTEDLDDSSFAGQQESYLNVKGNTDVIQIVKRVLASLFTARAIYYRKKRGFSKEKFALAAVVQKMIDSDKSGVMFSTNPIKKTNTILIEAVFGLGEGIVSGKIKPDSYEVSKELEILDKKISDKKIALTRNSQGDTETVKLTPDRSESQVLNESEIKRFAELGVRIEKHYGKPQDIEFAVEGGELYIVQSRPVTTKVKETADAKIEGDEILSGLGASPGVSSGKVRIIKEISELSKVQKGDVLVTEMTNPDMVVSMQKAAAIITNEGGVTSHAAIVSREMGIPAVVGTGDATSKLKDNQIITVDGTNGKVFSGKGETVKVEIKPVVPTSKVKIKVIVDLPAATERAAKTKTEGIGLMRLEGIIASAQRHPLKFIKDGKDEEYIQLLKDGISKISEPFKEIWIRTSDLRTDEFESLEGSPEVEGNPMLGDHGIRFSLKNQKILEAELKAIKQCAEKYPDKKFGFMIPQVISVEEVEKTIEIAEKLKLGKVRKGIMVETPSACFIIKNLIKTGIDFVSFGTNDLTQYILAIDRNNEDVQEIYDEMHPAVLNAIKRVLRTCNEFNVEASICGQAGSRKPMAKFLFENGINSISVNADAAHDISTYIAELESGENKENGEDKKGKLTPEETVGVLGKEAPKERIEIKEESVVEEKEEVKKEPTVEKKEEPKSERKVETKSEPPVNVEKKGANDSARENSNSQTHSEDSKHKHKFKKFKLKNKHNHPHQKPEQLVKQIIQKAEHEKQELAKSMIQSKETKVETPEHPEPKKHSFTPIKTLDNPEPQPDPTPEPNPEPEPQPEEPIPIIQKKQKQPPTYVADTVDQSQAIKQLFEGLEPDKNLPDPNKIGDLSEEELDEVMDIF